MAKLQKGIRACYLRGGIVSDSFDKAWGIVKEDTKRFSIDIDPARDRSGDDELYAEGNPCPLCGFNDMSEHACGTPGNPYCNDCCPKLFVQGHQNCGICSEHGDERDWIDYESDSGLRPEEVEARYLEYQNKNMEGME